jgi:ABC-2 type transport system permease protein
VIRLFAFSAYYSYKALFRWLKWEAYVFQKTLFPLMQLSFFTLVGVFSAAQPAAFYLVGNAIVVAFRPMFAVATAIRDERAQGTLPYLVASPANRIVLFFARAALHAVDGILDVVLALVFAVAVFGLDLPLAAWPGVFAAVVVASFAACGIGFFLGALSYLALDVLFMGNMVMFGLLLLTGANVPLTDLPDAARAVSYALPLTRSVEAARLYQTGAADLAAGLPLLAADLAIGAAWAIAGLALFSTVEFQARRRGTLEGV